MANTKILIAVKTYPQPSHKYEETVCTAGFREDGSWIRLYPIPFRTYEFKDQYKKWEWIEVDCIRNPKDPRPESHSPRDRTSPPRLLEETIDTSNNWAKRKVYALRDVYSNLDKLIADAKDPKKLVSLATFLPTEIVDFSWEATEREWSEKRSTELRQQQLFANAKDFKVVNKLPYNFYYHFKDDSSKTARLHIEDWEVGALYWNCIRGCGGDENEALKQMKLKLLSKFANENDLYFFLGTSMSWHLRAPNPFFIIGLFYPKKEKPSPQLRLGLD